MKNWQGWGNLFFLKKPWKNRLANGNTACYLKYSSYCHRYRFLILMIHVYSKCIINWRLVFRYKDGKWIISLFLGKQYGMALLVPSLIITSWIAGIVFDRWLLLFWWSPPLHVVFVCGTKFLHRVNSVVIWCWPTFLKILR